MREELEPCTVCFTEARVMAATISDSGEREKGGEERRREKGASERL